MNVSRLASLAAALAINAIVWAAFSSLPVHAQAVPVTAPAASSAPEAAVQEIVVTARRPS